MQVVYKDEYRTSLQGTACGPQATAFELLHSSPTRGITPTVLLECSGAVIPGSDKMAMGVNASTLNNNSEGHDGTVVGLPAKGGAFAMILPPPSGSEMHTPFGRRVVFLIDRSASMTGRPMEGAKQVTCCQAPARPRLPSSPVPSCHHHACRPTGAARPLLH